MAWWRMSRISRIESIVVSAFTIGFRRCKNEAYLHPVNEIQRNEILRLSHVNQS